MKSLRVLTCMVLLLLALSAILIGQTTSKFMPVDEVRPGMKGIGKTVFQGTKIDDFNVDILGVLKDYAPKQDMILARLSGGPLDQTGVIAGMSGSPVYIDGRLIGAVAFAFPFAKEPIAGIQPIGQMLNLLDIKPSFPTKVAQAGAVPPMAESPTAFVFNMIQRAAQGKPFQEILFPQSAASTGVAMSNGAMLTRIQSPLFISGATPAALQQFMPIFNSFGFTPVQAGGSASAPLIAQSAARLEPGASVNVEMIRGDISYSANGTVTYVDGDKVYAFGHPNLNAGSTDLPMSPGYVISLLPNLQNSFKMAVPLGIVGAFTQDRSTGISGRLGLQSKMIPVKLTMKSSTSAVTTYNFELANDRFLTPFLMNFTIFNSITASERALGESTLAVTGKIHLKDYEPINISNIFSGDMNGPALASVAAMAPVQYLMTTGFDGVVIEDIDLEIVSTERKSGAQLEGISVDKNEVRAGDTVNLTALLRGSNGDSFVERYPVQIPSGLPPGSVQLLVGDGTTTTATELRRGASGAPRDLTQIVRELNKLRKNDRLYIKILSNEPGVVIGGEEMPSLPPSMSALLSTDRSSNRSVAGMEKSAVREYELPQSKYVIQGQRTLNLTVTP